MKIILRLFAFAVSLILGVQVAVSWANINLSIPNDLTVENDESHYISKPRPPTGLYVTYAGFHRAIGDEGPYLRFLAYNGTPDPINYRGFGAEMPFPYIVGKGREVLGTFRCGRGSTSHSIDPGQTAEFMLSASDFDAIPKRRELITVGFHLRPEYFSESEVTNSEPFVLPDEFRSAIRRYQQQIYTSE